MQDLKTWRCGRCGLAIDLPDHKTEHDLWVAAMNRIREHRFAHLVTTLEHGSDEDLLGLCKDDDPCEVTARTPTGLVDSDDVTPVLEGITELLRADLPRARRLWYPVNEDGSFNREENK